MANEQSIILLTGGTGYIGGRLLPLLEQRGCRLRCVCRQPERLQFEDDFGPYAVHLYQTEPRFDAELGVTNAGKWTDNPHPRKMNGA